MNRNDALQEARMRTVEVLIDVLGIELFLNGREIRSVATPFTEWYGTFLPNMSGELQIRNLVWLSEWETHWVVSYQRLEPAKFKSARDALVYAKLKGWIYV